MSNLREFMDMIGIKEEILHPILFEVHINDGTIEVYPVINDVVGQRYTANIPMPIEKLIDIMDNVRYLRPIHKNNNSYRYRSIHY